MLGDHYYGPLLKSDESLNVTRLLVDYPTATASYLYGQSPLQNIREVWLSLQVDSWEYINDLQEVFADLGSALYFDGSGGMFNGFCTIYVSDEGELPNGLLSYSSKPLSPVYFVKVYSGDVYEAFKKGDSAAREWCPGHEYTGKAYTASRMKQHMTCQQPNEWYYSCKWCGINTRDDDLGLTYKFFLYSTGNKDVPGMKEAYNMYMEQKKNSWKKGGQNYEFSLNVTTKNNINTFSFAVPKSKKVVAKISENAQDGVYWAARNGLVDESILGDDFTKPLTRMQASAIAVALAEKLSGKSVSSAKSKTYSDTKSKYALKAAGAGIYGGASEGKFNPDGAVDRQQLATFFYQALMYAKKNKNVRYTPYESKLARYSDNAGIADWAKEAAAFMDALGLVEGSSRTKFLPEETLTIEQALVIANNSLDAPNIGWYQSGPSDTSGMAYPGDNNTRNCGVSTQLNYRPYERFWRPVAIPEKPGASVFDESFAILDPYTNDRLYVQKLKFFAVKAD